MSPPPATPQRAAPGSAAPRRLAVIGASGLMGHGIALALLAGTEADVVMVAHREASLARARDLVTSGRFGIERALARGKLDAAKAEAMRRRLHGTTRWDEGLTGVDAVFESVPETLATKRQVLAAAERHAPPEALIATGTSSIMIGELAGALADPSRLVGTHWFYPANVMPLIEVACGERTSGRTRERTLALLEAAGKRPVAVGDAPGFFMTRFVNLFVAEAIRAVELGIAGPAEVDEMVKTGLGWPMGVFELLDDTASFDSWYHAQCYLCEKLGERYSVPALARRAFEAGYRGDPALKPGSRGGWYEFLEVARRAEHGR